jgi:hypothetical protein
MKLSEVKLLDKHLDVLRDEARFQFLEGVTGSSKSFIGGIAFFLRVMNSPRGKNQFIVAASSVGTAEKMVIDNPSSFYNLFRGVCDYKKSGTGGARIEVSTETDTKRIYLIGYDNKARYKQILGLNIAGFLIEEIQITNDDFVREAFTRLYRDNGFLYATGNAGLPDQLVYQDYLNKGRPVDRWAKDIPTETLRELSEKEPDPNFRYWWFGFRDNPTLTEQQIGELYNSHPPGSFEYNSKILAIRGYVEGLLYAKLMDDLFISKENNGLGKNVRFQDINHGVAFERMNVGIDIGDRAKTVFVLSGTTRGHQRAVVIDSHEVTGEADYNEIVRQFNEWFRQYWTIYRGLIKSIRPDAADSLFIKTLRNNIEVRKVEVIASNKATIAERVAMKEQLLHQNRLVFTDLPGSQRVKQMLNKMKSDGKGGHLEENAPWNDYNDALDYSLTPEMFGLMSVKRR